MKYLLCLSLLIFVLMPGQAWAFTAEVTAYTQSQNNSVVAVHTAIVTGNATNLWWYIPLPRRTVYSSYFLQEPISATLTISPPAYLVPISENGEDVGVWAYFGDVSNATLTVRLETTVNVSIVLPGIIGDAMRTGSSTDPWFRPTKNCPTDMPGFEQLVWNLQAQVVAGTDQTTWGFLRRLARWMRDNITLRNSVTLEDNNARVVWSTRVASCLGLTNLCKSACVAAVPPIGSGIMFGYILTSTAVYPGTTHQLTVSTQTGGHAWNVVDDGEKWVPLDITNYTIGLVTLAYVSNGIPEDIEDFNSIIVWDLGNPVINWTTQVIGSANAGIFAGRGESSFPETGANFACQLFRPATVGVESTGQILDRSKRNTLCAWPNPASDWVDFQLYLNRRVHVRGEIFSSDGRLVKTIVDKEMDAEYNYCSCRTNKMPAGVYYLRLSLNNGEQVETQKFEVVR